MNATPLRFALLGAGFWARYQLAAWSEQAEARCVAVLDRDRQRARDLAGTCGANDYDDIRELFDREPLDFVDIVSSPDSHASLVGLTIDAGVPVICQKPLAPDLATARTLTDSAGRAGVPLLVHENWRWQAPLRALKAILDAGTIGRVFRARLQFASSFPVFDNQPFLKTLDRFILSDVGTHVLDVARWLCGEAATVHAITHRSRSDIRGEDVATVMIDCGGVAVVVHLSYASRLEHDRFPETFALIEGDRGSIELAPDYWLRVTTATGTEGRREPPPRYGWADPVYDLVMASMVPCQSNLLGSLRGVGPAETTAADNLRTLALVEAAYESARTGEVIRLPSPESP